MTAVKTYAEIALLIFAVPGWLGAVELQGATVAAWDDYVQAADRQMEMRLDGQRPFFRIDESADLRERLRKGEVVVEPAAGHGLRAVPGGLIHHWVGAVFIPGATVERLTEVLHDYDRYKNIYRPVVTGSRMLACTDAEQRFEMRWRRKILFLNAALDAEYQAREFLDGRRGYTIVSSTRVREIENYGQSDERLLQPDRGTGFMWRIHSIARFEESDGGVFFELEAFALTRDIPWSLKLLVSPLAGQIAIDALGTTLRQTRDAVVEPPGAGERLTSCVDRARSGGVPRGRGSE